MAVDLKVSRIRRHLAEGPSFGGQTAGTGGTPRHSYLPSIWWLSARWHFYGWLLNDTAPKLLFQMEKMILDILHFEN